MERIRSLILLFSALALVAIAASSCTTAQIGAPALSTAGPTPSPIVSTPTPAPPATLDWEKNHPERAPWSKALLAEVDAHFSSFDKAADARIFCPNYDYTSRAQKEFMWATLIVWTSYNECAWNPADASVDVGAVSDRDTWSVGLLQLSVVDQASYGFKFGYVYADLQDPVKNLHLGVAIMAQSIEKKKKLLIEVGESGLYWATLHPGGKYDKTAAIAVHTKGLGFCQ